MDEKQKFQTAKIIKIFFSNSEVGINIEKKLLKNLLKKHENIFFFSRTFIIKFIKSIRTVSNDALNCYESLCIATFGNNFF